MRSPSERASKGTNQIVKGTLPLSPSLLTWAAVLGPHVETIFLSTATPALVPLSWHICVHRPYPSRYVLFTLIYLGSAQAGHLPEMRHNPSRYPMNGANATKQSDMLASALSTKNGSRCGLHESALVILEILLWG